MAWIKEIEQTDTGAVAAYWEVIGIQYNHRTHLSVLEVGGWVSEAAYTANKNPLFYKSWEIPSGLAPELAAGALAFVSGYARAQPEFEGSEET
jgi:hypothetical protein